MQNTKQTITIAVVLIVVVAVLWWVFGTQNGAQNTAAPPGNGLPTAGVTVESSSTASSTSPSVPTTATQPKSPTTAAQPKSSASIAIIHPASGEKFVVGQNNLIQWSKEGGVSGSIYLVNSADKSTVGWINSEIAVHQTSYTWDTRDVFLSRSNPSKKDIVPGTYIIKLQFDSARLATVSSAPFQIIYPSQVQTPSYAISIKNFTFSPDNITVTKGTLLVFTNNDAVTHRIILQGFSPFTVTPGATLTFDTSVLAPSPYSFYSDVYSTMRLTVTVQ